jgi:hypothetical protein
MSPRGSEKRCHDRVSGRLTLQTLSSEYGKIEMETDNLSLGGATCLSSKSIPLMTRLRLNIFLPSTDGRPAHLHYPIEVDAVVVRSEPLNGTAPPRRTTAGGRSTGRADASRTDGQGAAGAAYRLALFFSGMEEKDRQVLASYLRSFSANCDGS